FGFDRKERGKPLRLRRLQPLFELLNVVRQERDARCEHVGGFLRRQRWQQRQPGLKLRKLFDRGAQNGAHPVPQFRYSPGGEVVGRFLGAVPLGGGVPCHDQARLHQQGDYRVQRPISELDAVLFVALAEGGGHLIWVHGALVEQYQDGESQRVGTFPFRLRHRLHPSTNIRLRVYVKEERLSRRLGSGCVELIVVCRGDLPTWSYGFAPCLGVYRRAKVVSLDTSRRRGGSPRFRRLLAPRPEARPP